MAWLTESEFREIYVTESATAVAEAQINQSLNSGIRLVTKSIGSAAANVVATATEPYSQKTLDLREAQGKLAYRELLLIQSSRSRDGGILESERDVNGDTINKYVPFNEIEARRKALFSAALEILENYQLDTEVNLIPPSYSSRVSVISDI